MAYTIEHVLHFIHLDITLSQRMAQRYVRWASITGDHEVYVWTRHLLLDTYIESLRAALLNFIGSTDNQCVSMTKSVGKVKLSVDRPICRRGRVAEWVRLTIFVCSTHILTPQCDPYIILYEMETWNNPKDALAMLALWILKEESGIYMDNSFEPPDYFPKNIVTDVSMLFKRTSDDPPQFSGEVIATIPENPTIDRLIERFNKRFLVEYDFFDDRPPYPNELVSERLRKLFTVEQELKKLKSSVWFRKEKLLAQRRALLAEHLDVVSFSPIITEFIFDLENASFKSNLTESTYIHETELSRTWLPISFNSYDFERQSYVDLYQQS